MAVGRGGVPWLFGQGCRPHRPTRASQAARDLTGSRVHLATTTAAGPITWPWTEPHDLRQRGLARRRAPIHGEDGATQAASGGRASMPRPATSGGARVPLRRLVTSDLQGPGAWDEDRFRAGVPAHRNEPVLDGGDHAAAGDGADLLGLHEHPVADLDHVGPPLEDDENPAPQVSSTPPAAFKTRRGGSPSGHPVAVLQPA